MIQLRFFILTSIFILFSINSSSQVMNDYEKLHLKGQVSSLKMKQFKAVEKYGEIIAQSIEQDDTSVSVAVDNHFYFDRKGKTIERHWFSNNSLNKKFIFKYDESSRILKKMEYNSNGKLDGITNYYYKYNNQGYIIEQKEISGETESDSFKKISRFENGYRTKEEYYYLYNNIPVEVKYYQNDQKGRVITETTSYGENKISEITTTEYNELGYISTLTTSFIESNLTECYRMLQNEIP